MISIEFTNGDIITGDIQGIGKGSGIYQIYDIETFLNIIHNISYVRLNPKGELYYDKRETWWYDVTKIIRIIDSKTEHRNAKIDIINES